MKILGIESSCDETACAVVEDGRKVLSNIVATSLEEHKLYGGVVPEIASRRHAESISGVVKEALEKADCTIDDIEAIAVTYAPGLIGALLVGVNFAKGLSFATGTPLVPVHHLRGHIALLSAEAIRILLRLMIIRILKLSAKHVMMRQARRLIRRAGLWALRIPAE